MTAKHILRSVTAVTTASTIIFCPISVSYARSANQMSDLVGAKASSGEAELETRGFTHIVTSDGANNTRQSYWWNSRDKNCLHVETSEGRYSAITDGTSGDCHQNNGTAAAVAGAAAGAILIGALLSHKSHHHDNNQHLSDAQAEAQYERGYNDGLYAAPYHNYDRNDAYASGYQAGVDQRNINVGHHHRRGGYAQVAQFADLRGARAAGAMDDLERRGFRQVDNFESGFTRYSIQWRAASRQCLQVTIADGHVYDISDIQTHPKCR